MLNSAHMSTVAYKLVRRLHNRTCLHCTLLTFMPGYLMDMAK
jgi:hypothetical protein